MARPQQSHQKYEFSTAPLRICDLTPGDSGGRRCAAVNAPCKIPACVDISESVSDSSKDLSWRTCRLGETIFVRSRILDKGPAARVDLCVEGTSMLPVLASGLAVVVEHHHSPVGSRNFFHLSLLFSTEYNGALYLEFIVLAGRYLWWIYSPNRTR